MAVNPNPTLPKPAKKKGSGKSKGFTTEELKNYLLLGGNLGDISGNKITQGQVLGAISDPATLQVILSALASNYGGGAYDPQTVYSDDVPTFESQYNPIKDKYGSLKGVEAQIASDFFSAIDEGTDPDTAAANLVDKTFMKNTYGVDISKGPVATLAGKLTADGKKYQVAETKRTAATEKQNYDAWRKTVTDKGGNFSEYLSKALGIPALAGLPDPSQGYSATSEDVGAKTGLLQSINPNWAKGPYAPTKAEIAAAKKYAAGIRSTEGRPDQITTDINKAFGVGEFAGDTNYLPTSIGGYSTGLGWLNKRIGEIASAPIKLAGGFSTAGGYNPFQGTADKDELAKMDRVLQDKAYKDFISKTSGATSQRQEEQRRERVLRLAAQKITQRGQKLQEQGVTPFTQQLPAIQAILGGTSLPIVKN